MKSCVYRPCVLSVVKSQQVDGKNNDDHKIKTVRSAQRNFVVEKTRLSLKDRRNLAERSLLMPNEVDDEGSWPKNRDNIKL